jgi:hypothetical protein
MLGGGIVDCSTGGAAAGAASAIGKVEPGFGMTKRRVLSASSVPTNESLECM